MNRKKIVYIVGGIYSVSGMNQVLTQKMNWLARNTDYQLYMVLTERQDLPCAFDIDPSISSVNFNINFDELDTMPLVNKIWSYQKKQRKYKRALTKYLMEIKADIVVSACRREINFINDIPDGSHKIGEIHFGRNHYRKFYKSWLPKFVCNRVSKLWIGKFIHEVTRLERFIVLSQEDSHNWPELTNIEVISNPLKRIPTEFSNCEQKRVIAAGRYTWQKGFDLLMQAWVDVQKQHPDWQLQIFGPGDSTYYKQLANDLGIQLTTFCNGPTTDIYKEYINSSVFILSSRYEGFGLVLAEAMSCGVPAVSFACPCGPRDIITEGIDGLLIKLGNTEDMAKAINQLIENKEQRKAMGAEAKKTALKFRESETMMKWLQLFTEIMK